MDEPDHSLATARVAADRDELGDWVARFLASPGSDNAELAEELTGRLGWWTGPVRLPIDQLHRLAGPEGSPALRAVDDDFWRDDVDEMAQQMAQGWEPPPLIVGVSDEQLVLEDGNHRVESLRRAGEDEAWSVVGFRSAEERDRFVAERSST